VNIRAEPGTSKVSISLSVTFDSIAKYGGDEELHLYETIFFITVIHNLYHVILDLSLLVTKSWENITMHSDRVAVKLLEMFRLQCRAHNPFVY
jgi:hypothetical protein